MKKWVVFAICLWGSAFGALPPFAQSVREIGSLLHDPRLGELLGSSEPVREIIQVDEGYMIVSENYYVKAILKYSPMENNKVGPGSFEIQFEQPVHLKTGEEKD